MSRAHRTLARGSITLLLVFAVMFGLFLVLVQFLQTVLGYSARRASAGLLPMVFVLGWRTSMWVGVAMVGVAVAVAVLSVRGPKSDEQVGSTDALELVDAVSARG